MKTIMKRATRKEEGNVLILVLVLLVLGGLILAPLLGLMSTGLVSGQVCESKTLEYYAADAGVEDAIWKILNEVEELPYSPCGDQSWSYDYQIVNGISGRDVEVTIEYSGGYTHLITSTATSDDGRSTTLQVSVTLDVEVSEEEGFFDSDWDVIEEGEGDYKLEAGGYDPSDIQVVNGNIELGEDSTVDGNVWAENGNVILGDGATVTGSMLTQNGNVDVGKYTTIGSEGNPVVICSARDVDLLEGTTVYGDIYAEQAVHLKPGATVYGDIYSNTEANVIDGGTVTGDVYYMNGYYPDVQNGGTVGGNIIQLTEWPGCPLGGAPSTTTITGLSIDSWQIG